MLFEWLPACALMFLSSQILLDANTIQLGSLPDGVYAASPTQASHERAVYEVCVCPSGKIYLSPAESTSTCQAMSNICLWSWPGSSDRGKPSTSAPQRLRLLRLMESQTEMELKLFTVWAEFRLAQKHPSPPPARVCRMSGLSYRWPALEEQLFWNQEYPTRTGTFPLP